MELQALIWALALFRPTLCINNTRTNSSDPNKDMYVIHAMVYQVGILTNKTDDKVPNGRMGNQEALTFYHTNGSNVDLSNIPAPLLTNVTAQSMVQVAPKPAASNGGNSQISWSALKDLASLQNNFSDIKSGGLKIVRRNVIDDYMPETIRESDYFVVPKTGSLNKRSVNTSSIFKRDVSEDKTTVKVVKGTAVIPPVAGVQSIAIPALLSLNNNFSEIPVPIPNTSVVHYAKINTVARKP